MNDNGNVVAEAYRTPADSLDTYTIEWQVGGSDITLGPADPEGGASMFDTRVGVECESPGRKSLMFRLRHVRFNKSQRKLVDGPTIVFQASASINVE